jgi:hypothetical protein
VTPAILTEGLHDFPASHQASASIRPTPLLSKSFPTHDSPAIPTIRHYIVGDIDSTIKYSQPPNILPSNIIQLGFVIRAGLCAPARHISHNQGHVAVQTAHVRAAIIAPPKTLPNALPTPTHHVSAENW